MFRILAHSTGVLVNPYGAFNEFQNCQYISVFVSTSHEEQPFAKSQECFVFDVLFAIVFVFGVEQSYLTPHCLQK